MNGPVLVGLRGQGEVQTSMAVTMSCVSVRRQAHQRAQEEQKGWNASQSWEAGMAKEVLPGTETLKMRPVGCTGDGQGKGQKLRVRTAQ